VLHCPEKGCLARLVGTHNGDDAPTRVERRALREALVTSDPDKFQTHAPTLKRSFPARPLPRRPKTSSRPIRALSAAVATTRRHTPDH
jgi:hypothetical protein